MLSPLKSPMPATFQFRSATVATLCVVALLPDSQMASAPVLPLRHRMSLLPSPLKSPLPAIFQAVDTVATLCVVALLPPSQRVSAPVLVVAPEDVALAVAVEVGGSDGKFAAAITELEEFDAGEGVSRRRYRQPGWCR